MVPFRRELDTASSRGRYGNAFSVTGVWSMNEKTQCTWHWQVEAYDLSKWASAGIKGCLWNTPSSFLSSGDICFWSVSIVKRFRRCAEPCQRFMTPDDTHDLCVKCLGKLRAGALCSRGNGVRSLRDFFLWNALLSLVLVIDRYWFFITDTDTDYLYVYVTDNRYSEPIFIYCYKVNK